MSVQIQLPAEPGYAIVLRSTAAAMAARCNLTYDRLEDARLAVDEAFGQILAFAPAGATVLCSFEEESEALHFEISAPCELDSQLPTDTFAWMVLSALADELTSRVERGLLTIRVRVHEPQGANA